MDQRDVEDGGLVVHNLSISPSATKPPTTLQTQSAIASDHGATRTPRSDPQRATNAAIITLSVISSIAMVITIIWYICIRHREKLSQTHSRTSSGDTGGSQSRTRSVSKSRSKKMHVQPLKTSFQPSFKSSFGLTGVSPDSPWSRTEGTITPLTRAAGQEFLYSPALESGTLPLLSDPSSARQLRPSSTLASPPPVTAHTNRTFRTSIHSLMVNRDSMTTNTPSLSEDFFPLLSNPNRPRTRLPSYHTNDAKSSKSSPYASDIKKGFIPSPSRPPSETDDSSPSEYTPSSNEHVQIPPLPIPIKYKPLALPSTKPLQITRSRSQKIPLTSIKTRESLKEYLDENESHSPNSSTASARARVNSSSPYSARPSLSSTTNGHGLSDDLRGLLFLASSVVVDDRPRPGPRVSVSGPADPDLSPTGGWTGLPERERRVGSWSDHKVPSFGKCSQAQARVRVE